MSNATPYFSQKQLHLGGRIIPMISGEVHYWRINPQQWRPALERVKEMGIHLVASYVCWDFHEVAPGEFDFTGRTDERRNLVAFLSLLQEMDFDIIIRPGPYIYSEWKNNGVPDRVARFHRFDPRFTAEAEPYIHAVMAVLRPFLATQGGRIVLLQAENEIDPWPALFTEPLGLGKTAGEFHQFLQEQYESVEALNRSWSANFLSFDQAHAVCVDRPEHPELLVRYLDFVRFKHWYVKKTASWAVSTYRAAGADVPIILNGYDGPGTQHWGEMERVADVFGQDIYPSNEFEKWQDEFRFLLEKGRFARAISRVPYIGEFEAGVWHGWHYLTGALTANHYRMAAVGALAGGIVGWNWYMLVNRDNWYMSPINEWGRTRPELFTTFKSIVAAFERLQPATLEHRCSLAVSIDPLQRSLVKPGEGMLKAFHKAGLDYEFFDLWSGSCEMPLLFYAGGSWLGRTGQQRLLDYVRKGGHLVFMGTFPQYDEFLAEYQAISMNKADGMIPLNGELKVKLNGAEFRCGCGSIEWFETVPGTPITAVRVSANNLSSEELVYQHSLENGQEYTIGFTRSEGLGQITYLGIQPDAGVLQQVIKALGVKQPVECSHPQWSVTLYQREGRGYLTVVNPTAIEGSCEIRVNDLWQGEGIEIGDMLRGQVWSGQVQQGKVSLVCSLPAKDATILELTPSASTRGVQGLANRDKSNG